MLSARQVLWELGDIHRDLLMVLMDFLYEFEIDLENNGVRGKTIHNYERILMRFFKFIEKEEKRLKKRFWVRRRDAHE